MKELKKLKLEELSAEQKLGMMLCARRFTPDDMEFTLELIKNHALGCVQVPINAQTPEIIEKIKSAADYPILIFNDMEQGYPRSDVPMLPAMTMAACNNKEYYHSFARAVVSSAKKEGFSGTWCPVVDILRCDGPCRVQRIYGDTPEKVIFPAEEINEIFKEYGFIGTGKHYPGGEDCDFDTHMAEGTSDVSKEEFIEYDLKPYIYLNNKGLLPAIMTRHAICRKIDPKYPATLSKPVIDMIREQGFDGVCFTDSLAMMGILQKYGEENILGMAAYAGNDIILPNYRTSTKACYEMFLKNYRDGMFSEERLNEAVRRVLNMMEFIADNAEKSVEITEKDRENLENVAKDCITAVTFDGAEASLGDPEKRRLFVIVTEMGFKADSPVAEIRTGKWYYPENIAAKIKEEFPNSEVKFISEFASAGENDGVLTAATKHDEVVFVTFCTTTSYLGTDCLTRRTESVINCLILSGKVSAVLHFGNPSALKTIHHVPRRIFGYTAATSQKYAIEVLAGKIPAKGKLPFDIKFE